MARLSAEVARLTERAQYVLPRTVQDAASRSVFLLRLGSDADGAVGTGVFFHRGLAITANHNLASLQPGDACFGTVLTDAEPAQLQFSVVLRDAGMDAALLRCRSDYGHFLERYDGPPQDLVSRNLALVAFQPALQGELHEFRSISMGVFHALPAKLSRHSTHALYQSTTWSGYSGAALLMFDGKPAGIHLAIVNELQAAMEQAGSLDQRVSELESSVNSMVSGASQGCLALLSCAFPADPVPGGP